MEDLVRWLSAQLDEDEERAHSSEVKGDDPEWWVSPVPSSRDLYAVRGERDHVAIARVQRLYDVDGRTVVLDGRAVAEHIAEHDPARVLREIDAKRRVVGLHKPIPDPTPPFRDVDGFLCSVCTAGGAMYDQQRGVLFTDLTVFPCTTLRLLALPYADRPGYEEEWAP